MLNTLDSIDLYFFDFNIIINNFYINYLNNRFNLLCYDNSIIK